MPTVIYPNFERVWRAVFRRGSEVKEYTDPLKVSVEFSQGIVFEPSAFTLSLFGLDDSERSFCMRKGTLVEFHAGYKSIGAGLFYRGLIQWGQPIVDGADWGIKVQSFGVGNFNTHIRIPSGTTHAAVLRSILAVYETATGQPILRGSVIDPPGVTARTRVLTGSVQKLLQDYGRDHGLEVDIVNGAVQAIPAGGDTGDGTVLVTVETGLEGAPEVIKAGFGALVFVPVGARWQMRMRPDVRVGRRVDVVSKLLPGGRGSYVVRRLSAKLDSREAAWTLTCEGSGR